jgi:Ca2+-binding EF-hand superfamily protein
MGCTSSVASSSSSSSSPSFAEPHEVAKTTEFSGGTPIVPSSITSPSSTSFPGHYKRKSSIKGEQPREIAPKSTPIVKNSQKSILKKTTLINAPILADSDEGKSEATRHPDDPSSSSFNPHALAPVDSQLQGASLGGFIGNPSQLSGNSKNSKTSRGSKSPSTSPAHSPKLGSKQIPSKNSRNSPRTDKEKENPQVISQFTGKEGEEKNFSIGPPSVVIDSLTTAGQVKITSIQYNDGFSDNLTVPSVAIGSSASVSPYNASGMFFSTSPVLTPQFSPQPPSISPAASNDATQSLRRRRRLQRRTSHRGMLSKLALKFPYVRASVTAVHKVFIQYHLQRLEEEELSKQHSSSSPLNTLRIDSNLIDHNETAHQQTLTASAVQLDSTNASPQTGAAVLSALVSPKSPTNVPSTPPDTEAKASTPLGESSLQSHQRRRNVYDMEAITLDKLHSILCMIGEKKQWTNEEVLDLFHLADLDKSKTISFREFLIAIAIGYFLKVEDSTDPTFLEIQRGFKVVQDAFKEMDTDNSNSVDAAELKKALFDTVLDTNSPMAAKNHQELLEKRFAELDFDHDGDIYFTEFLFGFVGWVFTENEEMKGQLNWVEHETTHGR